MRSDGSAPVLGPQSAIRRHDPHGAVCASRRRRGELSLGRRGRPVRHVHRQRRLRRRGSHRDAFHLREHRAACVEHLHINAARRLSAEHPRGCRPHHLGRLRVPPHGIRQRRAGATRRDQRRHALQRRIHHRDRRRTRRRRQCAQRLTRARPQRCYALIRRAVRHPGRRKVRIPRRRRRGDRQSRLHRGHRCPRGQRITRWRRVDAALAIHRRAHAYRPRAGLSRGRQRDLHGHRCGHDQRPPPHRVSHDPRTRTARRHGRRDLRQHASRRIHRLSLHHVRRHFWITGRQLHGHGVAARERRGRRHRQPIPLARKRIRRQVHPARRRRPVRRPVDPRAAHPRLHIGYQRGRRGRRRRHQRAVT